MAESLNRSEGIKKLLRIYRRNLQILEEQIAMFGGEKVEAPLHKINQRDEILEKIEQLEQELASLNVQETTGFSTAPELSLEAFEARLEGQLGVDLAEQILAVLRQTQPGSGQQISITGDGNVVGNNNTVIVVKDGKLKQQLHQVAPAVIPAPPAIPAPIRIYLSASPDQLADYEVLTWHLLKLDLPDTRIELVESQATSPDEVKLLLEQKCDLFIGLYGAKYGDVMPGEALSLTEIEYFHARRLSKPLLLYCKTNTNTEPDQITFLDFVHGFQTNQTLKPYETIVALVRLIEADVQAAIKQHPEWSTRPPVHGRVLLASLGLSPGVVTGMYYALAGIGKQPTRVVTFSPTHNDLRRAADICRKEFERLQVSYSNRWIDFEDIDSTEAAHAFKGTFYTLLQEIQESGAEVLVGITGGRSVMGALMAIVVQTTAPVHVSMYHLDVDDDIERDGRLPDLLRFQYDDTRWRELLTPAPEKRRLVQVPYVKIPSNENT